MAKGFLCDHRVIKLILASCLPLLMIFVLLSVLLNRFSMKDGEKSNTSSVRNSTSFFCFERNLNHYITSLELRFVATLVSILNKSVGVIKVSVCLLTLSN